jgi:hypothetical protein
MVFLLKKTDAYLRPHDQIRFDNWQFDRRLGGQGWHNNWNYQLDQQGFYNQNTCDGYNHDNWNWNMYEENVVILTCTISNHNHCLIF